MVISVADLIGSDAGAVACIVGCGWSVWRAYGRLCVHPAVGACDGHGNVSSGGVCSGYASAVGALDVRYFAWSEARQHGVDMLPPVAPPCCTGD
ncbi:hypothetical protein JVT61DRAFT_5247 [Boletus reticuloceps]|uniref:Uncharacterized protein n=1 Tax=Boletus reticuloceps TaxID=495285 RepID=A0A8I3AD12_9AGAM|nr:hypothetical protein JVT61DRAFT_5247 [Boletus reticuloceps]